MARAEILVVEDEAITGLDIRSRLERAGYAVPGVVSSAEEAIERLASSLPNLVLMDIHLKGEMDGIQAAERIRDRYAIPVVYLTAYADSETLQRAKATGPYGYLIKPFEEREIHATIEMALYKHEMERKLQESEQWLSTILHSIGDGVIATDAQGCVRLMNPVAESLTGWREEEALAHHMSEIWTIVPENVGTPPGDPIPSVLQNRPETGHEPSCLFRNTDGARIPIDQTVSPIRDANGNVAGSVLVFRDITQRRRAEKTLREYAQDLEARNEELDAFAHTVAHDLKDPLILIMGFAEMIAEDWGTMSKTQVEDYLILISRNGSRINNIIDELLLLSQVRKLDVEKEPLDTERLVRSAMGRLTYLIEQHKAEIRGPDHWPYAEGHEPWIEEVWVNLLSNAIKYGGRPPRVELGATVEGDSVRFWVRDNGHGVSPEDRERLFTPFTRLDKVRARGYGLGLSVVRRIIDKLGGQVGVESSGLPNQGSTFYFVLPLWDEGNKR